MQFSCGKFSELVVEALICLISNIFAENLIIFPKKIFKIKISHYCNFRLNTADIMSYHRYKFRKITFNIIDPRVSHRSSSLQFPMHMHIYNAKN